MLGNNSWTNRWILYIKTLNSRVSPALLSGQNSAGYLKRHFDNLFVFMVCSVFCHLQSGLSVSSALCVGELSSQVEKRSYNCLIKQDA